MDCRITYVVVVYEGLLEIQSDRAWSREGEKVELSEQGSLLPLPAPSSCPCLPFPLHSAAPSYPDPPVPACPASPEPPVPASPPSALAPKDSTAPACPDPPVPACPASPEPPVPASPPSALAPKDSTAPACPDPPVSCPSYPGSPIPPHPASMHNAAPDCPGPPLTPLSLPDPFPHTQRGPILPCLEELGKPRDEKAITAGVALLALPLLVLTPYPAELVLAFEQLTRAGSLSVGGPDF